VSYRNEPNATIAPTHGVPQRSKLVSLSFIGDHSELDAIVSGGAVDQPE
jgi:hypothetical protein